MAPSTESTPPPDTPSGSEALDDDGTTKTVPLRRADEPETTDQATVATATVLGRLRKTRAVGLYVALLAAVLVLIAVSLRQAWVVMGSAATGITLSKSGLVRQADERWPGVERHDRIIAIDGRLVDEVPATGPRLLGVGPGPLTLRLSRGERSWEVQSYAAPRGLGEQLAIAFRLLVGLVVLVSGFLAFVLRPGLRASWLFVLSASAFGSFVLGEIAFHDQWPVLGGRHQALMVMLSASLCIHLFTEFPRRAPFVSRSPRRVIWLYVPSLVLVVPFLATFPRLELMGVWEAASLGMRIWLAMATLIAAGLVWLQVRLARRNADRAALAQCRAIIVAMAVGLVLPAAVNAVRLAFDVGIDPHYAHLNVAPVAFFVGLTFYALVRHNMLAVDRFTAAVVGYGTTVGVLIALSAAVLVGLPLLVGQSALFESRAAIVVVTVAVVLAFSPAYRALKRRIDGWFFRSPVDLGRAVQLLQKLKWARKVADLGHARRAGLEAALALGASSAQLWQVTDDGQAVARAEGVGEEPSEAVGEVSRGSALERGLLRAGAGGVDGLAARTLDSAAQTELWELEMAAAAPIVAHGVFAGLLTVGRKRSGLAFGAEELSFLDAVASEMATAMELDQRNEEQLGRYRIERRLGTGGMAEVFLAWQLGPGGFERKVALKRPLPHLADDAESIAMLLDEARIASQLQHPNIVQIYEIDQRDGATFIAMEFVDGPSLRRVLLTARERSRPLPLPVAVGIASSVLAALAHAHEQLDPRGAPLGLVHRDVTPGNILLTPGGQAKLADFGIARSAVRLQVTESGMAKGTPPYMAPEQAYGESADHRADLFSTGAVLYEMVAGRRPFPHGPIQWKPGPIAKLDPEVPGALSGVLARALEFELERRYATAREMRAELLESLAPDAPATADQIADWLRTL